MKILEVLVPMTSSLFLRWFWVVRHAVYSLRWLRWELGRRKRSCPPHLPPLRVPTSIPPPAADDLAVGVLCGSAGTDPPRPHANALEFIVPRGRQEPTVAPPEDFDRLDDH